MRQLLYILAVSCLLLSSCGGLQKRTLFFRDNEYTDTTVLITKIPAYIQSIIQTDDILAIKISSISDFTEKNPVSIFNEGGIEYNLTPSGNGGVGSAGSVKGYLVDADGYIDFPVLGKLKVLGLTMRNVKDILSEKLRDNYVKDPVVEIRILNYKVSVLGSIKYPGVVIAPNHRLNVMEALSAAGDITIEGRRDNVMVIRENNGRREFARLNLNSRNAFTNPYFYLKQNDIVYVEAGRVQRQLNHNDLIRIYLPAIATFITTIFGIVAIEKLTK